MLLYARFSRGGANFVRVAETFHAMDVLAVTSKGENRTWFLIFRVESFNSPLVIEGVTPLHECFSVQRRYFIRRFSKAVSVTARDSR